MGGRALARPLLLLMLLGACSPVAMLNAAAPRRGVVMHQDITYRPAAKLALDIYAPMRKVGALADADAPVVVFFHGGGWEDGNRAMYRFVGATLASRGIVTVIPDYRLYPAVRFPAFMHDGAAAVAWVRAHIGTYGGNPDRLFLMGHSAGAQIATLLALDGRYLRADHMAPRDLAGVIGLAGPYDFLPLHSATLKKIFGPPAERPLSQPINFVTPGAPPMFLATGSTDKIVDPGNTARLAARLRAAGDAVETRIYPGISHEVLIGAFSSLLRFLTPARADTLRFIAAHGVPAHLETAQAGTASQAGAAPQAVAAQ